MLPSPRAEILIAAAAAFTAAAVSALVLAAGVPVMLLLSAAGGAVLLFLFMEIETATPVPRREFIVSGEIAIIALTMLVSALFIAQLNTVSVICAFFIYFICDFLFVRKRCNNQRDMLFTGFLVHCVAAIITVFLILKNVISQQAVTALLSADTHIYALHPYIFSAVIFCFTAIVLFLLPRVRDYISPVASSKNPALYWAVYTILIFMRDISLFAAFCISGVCMLPLDIRRSYSPAASRITMLAVYIIIAVSAAAAAVSGYHIIAVICSVLVSFIAYGITYRRRKTYVFSQRSFIHCRR